MSDKKFILGTAQMGLNYGINNATGKIPYKSAISILLEAYESGIDTLDTAEGYGDAHNIIGAFHRKYPKYKFKINTKISKISVGESLDLKIINLLAELNVSSINTLMFHSYDDYVENIKLVKTLFELKKKKVILNIGVSVYKNSNIQKLCLDEYIDVIQLPFNMLDNSSKRGEILDIIKNNNKVVHVRSAFLQGLFFKNINDKSLIYNKLRKELKVIRETSVDNGVSVCDLALAYCFNQKNIDGVIVGVDNLEQLKLNLNSLTIKLSKEILSTINSINVKNTELLNPSLWKKIK
jgi:uncharacterized protein